MPQIINDNPGLGALLGTGIASGLQGLAQHKLNQLGSRAQQIKGAQGLASLGIPEREALAIAGLPEALQGVVVKNYLAAAEARGLEQALAALRSDQPSGGQGADQQSPMQAAQQFYGQSSPQQPAALSALQGLSAQQPGAMAQQLPVQKEGAPKAQGMPDSSNSFVDLLRGARVSPQARLKLEQLQQTKDLHRQKLEAKEREIINKETKPYYDEVTKGAKAAQNNFKRLDRMEELIRRGNLTWAIWENALDVLGDKFLHIPLNLKALTHPDSQEFRKLSNDFLKDAKEVFGSRLTNYDVQSFLETVPTLSQSDEGKLRVIHNMRSFGNAALIRKKAMDDIIKENGGRRPANLDSLVEERVAPQLDSLAEAFKKGAPGEEIQGLPHWEAAQKGLESQLFYD